MAISDEAFEVLRTVPLFAGFTQEQLEEVPKVATPRTFEAGDVIASEGELGARSLWLIVDGEVEVRVGGRPLRKEGPGAHLGEMALLTDAPRSADLVASERTTVLQLSRDHLRGLIHANPDAALAMLSVLSLRLREITEIVAELLGESPEAAEFARKRGLVALGWDRGPHLGPIEYALGLADDD